MQNKLRAVWEFQNHTLLQKYFCLNLPNKIYVASDEFFVELDIPSQADQIINDISPNPQIFKWQTYQLYRINEFITSLKNKGYLIDPSSIEYPPYYLIRIDSDKNKYSLIGCTPDDHAHLTIIFNSYFG